MNTPFGAPFEELELAHLTTYFEELRAETLAWEAKGGQIRPEHVRDGVCGFANSVLGGYLVLGVSRADPKAKAGERCRYKVDGWEQEDPATWIGSCIGYGGISPRPSYNVRPFAIQDTSRWVAVVYVRPSPAPPCITLDGEVFERLSGQTWRVNTSEALRALYARGEAARTWARQESASICQNLLANGPELNARYAQLVAVAAPATSQLDVSSDLFRRATVEHIEQLPRTLPGGPNYLTDASLEIAQDSITSWASKPGGTNYLVRAHRNGSVAVAYIDRDSQFDGLVDLYQTQTRLGKMWGLANSLVHKLGAYGPSQVSVLATRRLDTGKGPVYINLESSVDGDPTADELGRVGREAGRALGEYVFEPEPQED